MKKASTTDIRFSPILMTDEETKASTMDEERSQNMSFNYIEYVVNKLSDSLSNSRLSSYKKKHINYKLKQY